MLDWFFLNAWNCRSKNDFVYTHGIGILLTDSDPSPASSEQLQYYCAQRMDFNHFAAALTASGVSDHKHIGLREVRRALEDEPWVRAGIYSQFSDFNDVYNAHQESIKISDSLVPAAAQWFFAAGYTMFDSREVHTPESKVGNIGVRGRLWRG